MSFPKKDRNLRSQNGNDGSRSGVMGSAPFAHAVAAALRSQYGAYRSAVKHVASLTGANERAVKNWFDARNGPSGFYLVLLARHSDDVLHLVLSLAGRGDLLVSLEITEVRAALVRAVALIDGIPN